MPGFLNELLHRRRLSLRGLLSSIAHFCFIFFANVNPNQDYYFCKPQLLGNTLFKCQLFSGRYTERYPLYFTNYLTIK